MMMWSSQENTTGPKQYKKSFWPSSWRDEVPVSQDQIQNERQIQNECEGHLDAIPHLF